MAAQSFNLSLQKTNNGLNSIEKHLGILYANLAEMTKQKANMLVSGILTQKEATNNFLQKRVQAFKQINKYLNLNIL